MIISEALLEEHSKQQTMRVATYIGNDKKHFAELMRCMLGSDKLLSQRAAWVFGHAAEANPSLLSSYYPKLIDILKQDKLHDALKRNIMRAFQYADIPEKHQGEIYDVTLQLVLSIKEAIAVRAFGLTVLYHIAKPHKELCDELKVILDDLKTYSEIPALVSRSKKVLMEMKKN